MRKKKVNEQVKEGGRKERKKEEGKERRVLKEYKSTEGKEVKEDFGREYKK